MLNLKGKTFTLVVRSSDTASEVKARIEEKIGINAQVQTLTHNGRELRDDVRMSGLENITLLCLIGCFTVICNGDTRSWRESPSLIAWLDSVMQAS